MSLDATALRKVRKGVRVMMGPFMWEVVKVTTSGQAWLRDPADPTGSLIVRDCSACTVYDSRLPAVEPAGPADVPLMPEAAMLK